MDNFDRMEAALIRIEAETKKMSNEWLRLSQEHAEMKAWIEQVIQHVGPEGESYLLCWPNGSLKTRRLLEAQGEVLIARISQP